MKKKTWIALIVLFIIVVSFITYLLINHKEIEFNIEDTEFSILNESNFNSIDIKEACFDCDGLEYKESIVINDYDVALDLIKIINKSKMEEISMEEGLEIPKVMATIMYEKESDGINYIYAITISAVSEEEAWVYIGEQNKYYLCKFNGIDIVEYISDLYNSGI